MSSADFNKDMRDLIDVRLSEIFKEHFSDSVEEEKVEEKKMFDELKEINKKIDNLTSILENLQVNGVSTTEVKQTRKPRTKKEDKVFIPDTDSNDMSFSSNNSKIQNISPNGINEALSALDNLK